MREQPGSPAVVPGPLWEISGDLLYLRLPDGSRLVPTADQIYRVAVEGEPSEDLPLPIVVRGSGSIDFSRHPLELEVRIEADHESDLNRLKAVAYATGANVLVALPGVSSREADHLTLNGQWYPFVKGSLEEIQDILRQASIGKAGELNLRQYLELLRLAGKFPAIHDRSGGAASALNQRVREEQDAPAGFAGELYPYQRDGWRWLQLLSSQEVGGILADEMGLGKTVQIAALLVSETNNGRKPCLVVATGTLLENWRRELAKFAPQLGVLIHQGPDRTGLPSEFEAHDVIVTSYDTLIRDLSLVRRIRWNVVVLDEAQAIKNATTKRASATKRIPRRVGFAVTGTPVENRLSDLWSITDFALPGFLGELATFEKSFSNDEHGAERLEPFISPILLRRRIADVAGDLPERIDIPQALELPVDQAAAYEEIRQAILAEYGAAAALVALTRLRMFCAHPGLLGPAVGDPEATSAKYERLTEILEEIFANGEKAIIFTSFNGMTDLLVEDLRKRFAVPTEYIDGRTPIDERQEVVDRFGGFTGAAVLVLNPRAAGTGLNITAANHVIHYNLEWNPAVEDQASARAYRRGQTRPVTVHRLFYVDTVEETIDDRVSAKRSLAGKAVVGTDGADDTLADIATALARSPVKKGASHAG